MGLLRILLVDDHERTRHGIRSLLTTRPDWVVCGEAVDGLDAVEKAQILRPDVVLMDISMPRMNGLEAARIIREELPQSEIVLVSQNSPAIVRRQAAEVNAHDFVAKDDLSVALLPAIDKIVAQRSTGSARPRWLNGGGEMGELIRSTDWSKSPLGALERWPQSLQLAVSLMLNSQHPIWIGWGKERTFLYNDAYISVLSLAKHPRSLGLPAQEVWAEIWDICGPLADKVFEQGEASFFSDVRLFMDRGDFLEETFYSFSYSPILDEAGNVVGLFCPSTESTAKNLNARRLRTLSELSAKALVEKSIQAACASAVSILGANPDDIPFAALYLVDSNSDSANLVQATPLPAEADLIIPPTMPLHGRTSSKEVFPFDKVFEAAQPEIVPVGHLDHLPLGPARQRLTEAIVLPVTSSGDSRPLGILVAGINPTRRLDSEYRTFFSLIADQVATAIQSARAAEEQKKRADALADLDRAKTTFFSNVSHEFRTPLTLLLGPLGDTLAKSQGGLSPEDKENLRVAHRNGLRLEKLVNTLLDFSRLEAGRVEASYQPTDICQFTAELASCFHSAMARAGLEFHVTCEPISEPVYIDRDMWEKVVLNLLSNAFKFTFHGKVAVAMKSIGQSFEMQVSDSGIGIPQAELPRVFERFHRVEGTQGRTHEGSGIGLALVQELVKLHGGAIRVDSVVGRGTTFTVTIPKGSDHLPQDRIETPRLLSSSAIRAESFVEEALGWLSRDSADAVARVDSDALEHPQEPSAGASGEIVLVVDDNSDMRQYVRRLLGVKYQVHAVANGRQAVEAARRLNPDLILTDVMMPGLDGFGLLAEIRNSPGLKTTPVILVSARAGEEERIVGLRAGADDYITKPFSARELLARVEGTLAVARIRRESTSAIREREERLRSLADTLEEKVRVRTEQLLQRNQEVVRQAQQLRALSKRLMQAQDEERRHIARELHDSAGQTLTALGMNLSQIVQKARQASPELSSDAQDSLRLAQQLSQEIRTMAYLLHPPLLDESGLSGALRWYTQGAMERSGVDISLDISPDFGRIPRDMELIVFRIVQECLTNIHRHSGSKTAFIRVLRDAGAVVVDVRDEGKGISPEKLAEIQTSQGSGVGISGMRERIRQHNGTLNIQSDGAGTNISIQLPLSARPTIRPENLEQELEATG
ncbi:MAG TPA: response regulator [Terriglobales bacterium]|jgi:signal transduction histidine kinase|nr:response regulator [Terriglobales bacterium]